MRSNQVAIVLAALTVAVSGCAANTPITAGPPPIECRAEGFPSPWAGVDPCAGEQVLLPAVRALFTYDPVEQPDPSQAVRHAGVLLDERFAADAATTSLVWGPVTSEQWQRWREAGVRVDTRVRRGADDHPQDTALSLARVVQVELVPSADAALIVFPAYATVSRAEASSGWRLSGLRVLS